MFPSDKIPSDRYKFSSLDIYFSQDKKVITQVTYNLFAFLSDIGGLMFILH